ncbi:hypothetical protein GCM10010423_62730 [Streptomyces levis]|uniref:Uncharacterized protein n=1 Tax=Streptomyces levis TaxID=285566 RepID=A0ABP6BB19_9ACTN
MVFGTGVLPLSVGQEDAAPADDSIDVVMIAAPVMPSADTPAITARRLVARRR